MVERRFEYDVFLSHSSRDIDHVRPLAARLKESDLHVWFDDRVRVGQEFDREIERALTSSRRVVAFWSPWYWKSDWCREESARALGLDLATDDIRYIPVMLDRCRPPERYRRFKYLDYTARNGAESEAAFLELLATASHGHSLRRRAGGLRAGQLAGGPVRDRKLQPAARRREADELQARPLLL
jgi:TIR domain-containing protein